MGMCSPRRNDKRYYLGKRLARKSVLRGPESRS